MNRRTTLRSLAVVVASLLGGCSLLQSPTVDDIRIRNEGNSTVTVDLDMIETETDESVLSENFELGASDDTSFEDPITKAGTYRVVVAVASDVMGQMTDQYTWELPTNDEAMGLSITIRLREIEFLQVSA